MANQNLVLLMSPTQLVEFENECLQELSHKEAKRIIKHLGSYMMEAGSLAQQIIKQNEQRKVTPKKDEEFKEAEESIKEEAPSDKLENGEDRVKK